MLGPHRIVVDWGRSPAGKRPPASAGRDQQYSMDEIYKIYFHVQRFACGDRDARTDGWSAVPDRPPAQRVDPTTRLENACDRTDGSSVAADIAVADTLLEMGPERDLPTRVPAMTSLYVRCGAWSTQENSGPVGSR